MKIPRSIRTAFTLIELLVVISIIAILAGASAPAIMNAVKQGRMAGSVQSARQIGLALHSYANDHDGAFPSTVDEDGNPLNTSNDVFRELVPSYVDTEKVFALGRSPVGKQADDVIEPEARILTRGENHWAYIAGLGPSSRSQWPLIVDHTDGSGHYATEESSPGGTWAGTHAVMVRCDASSHAVKLKGKGDRRYLPRHNDSQKNALLVNDYMGEGARLLEPAR